MIEGATGGSGSWSAAWRTVFQGNITPDDPKIDRMAARDAMEWVKEVRGMAGRGWDGYRWTIAKDICGTLATLNVDQELISGTLNLGFAAFFAIFDMTLKVAKQVTAVADESATSWSRDTTSSTIKSAPGAVVHHFPRTVHGVTLVTGGVFAGLAYEYICRPWYEFPHNLK